MLKKYIHLLLIGSLLWIVSMNACKHSPIVDMDGVTPIDTTSNPMDTTSNPMDSTSNPMDTTSTDTTGIDIPCEEDVIYFERDVLPLLQSNCAFSGCHDAASAEDGVILISYETVMATADVERFNLEDSEIYEVLVHSDPDERMPPTPRMPLPADQIQLIAEWILQGAENLSCDDNGTSCDTAQVSFSSFVKPLLDGTCVGCHSGNSPSGGVGLDSHARVAVVAENGKLFGAINHDNGFKAMPQGGSKLPQCDINKIKAWIDAGAINN